LPFCSSSDGSLCYSSDSDAYSCPSNTNTATSCPSGNEIGSCTISYMEVGVDGGSSPYTVTIHYYCAGGNSTMTPADIQNDCSTAGGTYMAGNTQCGGGGDAAAD